VLLADDAETAITLYEQHQARVALLLTDVRMSKMNGLELTDRILEREPRIRVLFMSGSDWSACRGFGCVAKPFTRAELVGRVAAALGGLGARGQAEFSLSSSSIQKDLFRGIPGL
jgi:CheY-like chemotaxis protein